MKYFLGEIYITHRKIMFVWMPCISNFTTFLIQAENWSHAQAKCKEYAEKRMENLKGKFKYEYYATSAIN